MAKEIGKQFFTGQLNLTTVTMPIEINVCKTALESLLLHTCYFPLFMGLTEKTTEPLERFQLVMTAILASQYPLHCFKKPLNPILGETFQGFYNDGTQLLVEQISHHPPISYYSLYGKNYQYFGYYDQEARAGLNGLKINNKGKRKIIFDNGQLIEFSFAQDKFSGMFIGTPSQELTGQFIFVDRVNNLQCQIKFGQKVNNISDHFRSDILKNGSIIGEIKGSYLSNVDINNKRYFDFRHQQPYKIQYCQNPLQSDSLYRPDLINMKISKINEAKLYKKQLEQQQRDDKKLREAR